VVGGLGTIRPGEPLETSEPAESDPFVEALHDLDDKPRRPPPPDRFRGGLTGALETRATRSSARRAAPNGPPPLVFHMEITFSALALRVSA
jgi:hypothetical protein